MYIYITFDFERQQHERKKKHKTKLKAPLSGLLKSIKEKNLHKATFFRQGRRTQPQYKKVDKNYEKKFVFGYKPSCTYCNISQSTGKKNCRFRNTDGFAM